MILAVAGQVGCATTDYVTGEKTFNRYSLLDDVDIGTRQATLILAAAEAQGMVIDPDEAITLAVRAVSARLLAVPENRARMPPFPWEVHVPGTQETNAWCFPGGHVLVLAGMMRAGIVRNEDELAAIIGHEMAHAAARHGTERATVQTLSRLLSPFGRFFGARLVELTSPGSSARAIAKLAVTASSYDQSQEIEADVIGLDMMARAGYDPRRALEIWSRLGKSDDDLTGAKVSETHPPYEARMRQLKEHLPVTAVVVHRRTGPAPRWPPRTGWQWTPRLKDAPFPKATLTSSGAMPVGAHVRGKWMTQRRRVLDVQVRVFTGVRGEAPRATVLVSASRSLWEDRLPLGVRLLVHRGAGPNRELILSRQLADRAPLSGPQTPMRIALPPLRAGKYLLTARGEVGSLRTESRSRFDVVAETRSPPK